MKRAIANNFMGLPKLFCWLLFAAAFGAVRSEALADNATDTTVTLVFGGQIVASSAGDSNGSLTLNETTVTPTATASQTGQLAFASVQLTPERAYDLTGSVDNSGSVNAYFNPPPGYILYIDGVPEKSFSFNYTTAHTLILRKNFGGPPGSMTGFQVGNIFWAVGLGQLPNGLPAGAITIRQQDYSTALFDRSVLNYDSFDPSVEVITDSNGTKLRQVRAPQTLVDIHDIDGGFQLDFYASAAINGFSNGLYTWSRAPFVSYTVTNNGQDGNLSLTRIFGSLSQPITASFDVGNTTWQMTSPGALRVENKTNTTNAAGDRVETTIVQDVNGNIASKTIRTYHTFSWGEELIQVVADPDGKAYTTTYTYYEGDPNAIPGSYSRQEDIIYPSGNWVHYTYYDSGNGSDPVTENGQLKAEYHPWLDNTNGPSGPDQASDTNCHVIKYDYTLDWSGMQTLEKSRVETINGTVVAQRFTTHDLSQTANNLLLWVQTQQVYSDASDSLTTITKTYQPDQSANNAIYDKLPYSAQHPDGTMESYAYVQGDFNASTNTLTPDPAGSDLQQIVLHGVIPAIGQAVGTTLPGQTGVAVQYSTLSGVNIDPIYLIPNYSTQTVNFLHNGQVVRTETWVYANGSFNLLAWSNSTYTDSGKLQSQLLSNGATYSATYANEFKTSETDASGAQTTYVPDSLYRVQSSTRKGAPGYGSYAAQPDIVTNYTYDAEGDVTQTQVAGAGLTLTAKSSYNFATQIISQTAPGGYITSYDYSQGGLVQTVTHPGGATTVTTTFLDGQKKSVTGTAQVAAYYTVSVGGSGIISTLQNNGTSASGNWALGATDWLGRMVLQRQPDSNGHNVDTVCTYNNAGQLIEKSTPGLAPTLYSYTPMGVLQRTAIDVNGNGVIDLAGPDRVSENDPQYFIQTPDGNWWQFTSFKMFYPYAGSNQVLLGPRARVRLTGFTNNTQAEVFFKDIDGNVTDATMTVDATDKLTTVMQTVPDSTTPAVQVTYNGMLVSSQNTHNITTTYAYDSLGRTAEVFDPRKGGITTQYYAGSSQVAVNAYAGGPNIAEYSYGLDGRVSSSADGDGHLTYFAYDSMGNIVKQWGDGTYPVSYAYDSFGRMTQQSTYRGGSGWNSAAWPAGNEGTADVTSFIYYGDLPLLETKKDAASNAVVSSYDSLGRISQRTTARGIVATYAYDPNTGDPTRVSYSDGTPEVDYNYTRMGALNTVSDITGTRTFAYRSNDLQLQSEALPAFFGSGYQLNYVYETASSGTVNGRLKEADLGTSANPSAYEACRYAFTSDGRITSVDGQAANSSYNYADYSFNYGYYAQSDALIGSIANSASGYTQSRTYDPHRDLITNLTTLQGSGSGNVQTQYDYTYDDLGRRVSAKQSGAAYDSDYGSPTFWRYAYNGRGEVIQAYAYAGSDITDLSQPLSGRLYDYGYDNIGNLTSVNHTGAAGLQDTYTANNLNQIATRENNTASVQGTASPDAYVTVNSPASGGHVSVNDPAGRAANYWGAEAFLNNTNGPAYESVGVTAKEVGSGSNLVATDSRNAYLPPGLEIFAYDADGNLTADGTWNYVYDAENRLVQIQTNSNAIAAGLPGVQLQFKYDFLGRRVEKKAYKWSAGWQWTSTTRFIYNGWNLIAEEAVDSSSNVTLGRTFTWGLDLSGSLDAMAGIGALLMIQDGGRTYLTAYDGSGNVTSLIDAVSGTRVASYEYDAYGRLLRKQGTYAASNPFRYSTKYWDEETGLVYYGDRYYSPGLGRFINRDPIEEAGGLNLYGFVANNPINSWDYLGHDDEGDDFSSDDWGSSDWGDGFDASSDDSDFGDYSSMPISNTPGLIADNTSSGSSSNSSGNSNSSSSNGSAVDPGSNYVAPTDLLSLAYDAASFVSSSSFNHSSPPDSNGSGSASFSVTTSDGSTVAFSEAYTPLSLGAELSVNTSSFTMNYSEISTMSGGSISLIDGMTAVSPTIIDTSSVFTYSSKANAPVSPPASGLTAGEIASAALSGAAQGLYNATIGSVVSAFSSGVDHMAGAITSAQSGDYAMATLNVVALGGDVAGLGLTVSGGGGEIEAAESSTTTLFRAVSPGEAADALANGLRPGPNSYATGKFFAESAENAAQWGKALEGPNNFQLLKVEFPTSTADQFMRWPRLDGIGPARFGTFEQMVPPPKITLLGPQ